MKAFRSRGKGRFPRVRFRGALQAPAGFDSLVSVGVSVTGPVAIWSSSSGEAELHGQYEQPPGGAVFPRTQPSTKPAVAITTYLDDPRPVSVTNVGALPVAHPLVDVLGDGSLLVVGARCSWMDGGPEPNALVIDRNGRTVRRGGLGDGIQHLQVARDGTIWTGYFDEGVFGNFGWGNPGPTPLGAGGIAVWNPEFVKLWELDPQIGLVADCYALNVAAEEVWACPYTDFPVLRIKDNEERTFATRDVSGPIGIVASGDRVGLIGTHRDPSLLIRGAVGDAGFHETDRAHLWSPDGSPLPPAQVHCRGSAVHFFAGRDWYSYELDSQA